MEKSFTSDILFLVFLMFPTTLASPLTALPGLISGIVFDGIVLRLVAALVLSGGIVAIFPPTSGYTVMDIGIGLCLLVAVVIWQFVGRFCKSVFIAQRDF